MKESIDSLFCNNPDLSHQIYTYCKANPEFMEAEAEYDALLQSLEQNLGYARMQEIEDCFLRYSARLVQAYYLFGLGLRQFIAGFRHSPLSAFPLFRRGRSQTGQRAATWGRPYGEPGSSSFFFVGAGHWPARIRGAPRSSRPTQKSVLSLPPHPPQCAHWGTFPPGGRLAGG